MLGGGGQRYYGHNDPDATPPELCKDFLGVPKRAVYGLKQANMLFSTGMDKVMVKRIGASKCAGGSACVYKLYHGGLLLSTHVDDFSGAIKKLIRAMWRNFLQWRRGTLVELSRM